MFSVNVTKISFLKIASALAAVSFLSGCGSPHHGVSAEAALSGANEATAATTQSQASEVHYDFVAREELRVKPINLGVVNPDEMIIPAGTPLTVLETKLDETHGTLVRLGMKGEEAAKLPADAWFLLDDTLLLALQTKEAASVASN